jgi:hypothetical protein
MPLVPFGLGNQRKYHKNKYQKPINVIALFHEKASNWLDLNWNYFLTPSIIIAACRTNSEFDRIAFIN